MVLSISVKGQKPVADFSISQTQGCAPQLIRFTDQSVNATQISWSFGNGSSSTDKNPGSIYTNPGEYTITLIAINAEGSDTLRKKINIFPKPAVDFSVNDSSGCFPFNARFTDLTSTGGSPAASWLWDFGDGSTSKEKNPVHTYRIDNQFNVTLKVTSQAGCVGSLTKNKFVDIENGITASYSFVFAESCKPPVNLNFFNTSQGPGNLSYKWTFGDGTAPSSEKDPTHLFSKAGGYPVYLIVSSDKGCSDSTVRVIAVQGGNYNTKIEAPDTVCKGQLVTFKNTSEPIAPDSSFWHFSDGEIVSGKSAQKNYTATGIYTVTLVNRFGDCTDSLKKKVVVVASPSASFTSTDTAGCATPFTAAFVNTSTNGVTWKWDFGDGTSSVAASPSKSYTKEGVYSISLTATNQWGCSTTSTQKDLIRVYAPKIRILNLPDSGCAPLTVAPKAIADAPDGVASWKWTMDGTTYDLEKPTHTFLKEGIFPVSVTVTSKGGCSSTVTLAEAVKTGTRPTAAFVVNSSLVCTSDTVAFSDRTTGNVTGWKWIFGDGFGGSKSQNPRYQYQDTGVFSVTLISFQNGCSDTLERKRLIEVKGPVARFSTEMSCTEKLKVSFTDQSKNVAKLTWNYGDGSPTSNIQNPVYQYATPGKYKVILTAEKDGCSVERFKEIDIIDIKASILNTNGPFCRSAEIPVSANADSSLIKEYLWDAGTGVFTAGSRHTKLRFDSNKVYTVQLAIKDLNGCMDTTSKIFSTEGPFANFASLKPTGCMGTLISFSDSSRTDGQHRIISRIWNFGDNNSVTGNDTTISHTYSKTGAFTISLEVKDEVGCTDRLEKTDYVMQSDPSVYFEALDTVSCPGKTIPFISQTSGSGLQLTWDFGNRATADKRNPVAQFDSVGMYDIKLFVTDRYGCTDSLVRSNYIRIDTPHAQLFADRTVISCPPLIAHFENRSTFYKSVMWYFGDGDRSILDTPTHLYNSPGVYQAKLVAKSPGGCTDTAWQTIQIKGPSGKLEVDKTSGCLPSTFRFTMSATNTDSVFWDFGDRTPIDVSWEKVREHTYTDTTGDLLPKILLQDSSGCRVAVTTERALRVIGIQPAFQADKKAVCDDEQISFIDLSRTNGQIEKILWDFGDGQTGSGSLARHSYAMTGTYNVKIKIITELGCTDSLTLPQYIRSVATPVAYIEAEDTLCAGRSIQFNGYTKTPDPSVKWAWNFANGQTANTASPNRQLFIQPGQYNIQLLVENEIGCKDTVYKDITVHPIPKVDAGVDSAICHGTSIILRSSGAARYIWKAEDATLSCLQCPSPTATPVKPVNYYQVTGISADGCQAADSVRITVIPPTRILASENDTICIGQGVTLYASGVEKYQWRPSTGLSDPNSATPVARPKVTTTYYVNGSDSKACSVTEDTVTIFVSDYPYYFAGRDTTILSGYSFTVNPTFSTDISTIRWSPSAGLSCTDCLKPIVSPKDKTTYQITVRNDNGCESTSNFTVTVNCNQENIFIPNTFSPNGDGMNEVFYIRGAGLTRIRSIQIYNRWGQQVFWKYDVRANEASAGWDGTFKGIQAKSDVYVYVAQVECENKTVMTVKGDVMLVR